MSKVKRVLSNFRTRLVVMRLGTPNLAIQCIRIDLAMDSAVVVETGMANE